METLRGCYGDIFILFFKGGVVIIKHPGNKSHSLPGDEATFDVFYVKTAAMEFEFDVAGISRFATLSFGGTTPS